MSAPVLLRRETLYAGYITLERVRLRLADGQEVWREVESHGDAVAVLPYDEARRTALTVRLHRAPALAVGVDDLLEEACAGMIDKADAEPATSVRREALEELGVALQALEPVAVVWTSPGVVAERCHLFLAPIRAVDRTGPGGGLAEEQESLEVVESPLARLAADAAAGAIVDAKLLILVQALQLRRPDLFDPAPAAG
jgi:nudix-type nucleoside diphosphatase (YffH/AdpP family)